jgi:hypothetical protein
MPEILHGDKCGSQHFSLKVVVMDERAFYRESQITKPASLNCPYCRTVDNYQLRWLLRKKIDRLPGHADERLKAKFKKAESYMVLLDDKVPCRNPRCRRTFDISGIKTTAYLAEEGLPREA